jgi:DNA-binding MarR family transcriptional regulator
MDRRKRPTRQTAARRRSQDFELRGPLQFDVMAVLWKLGSATINDIRAEQRRLKRRSYTTVGTVLDRLLDRGLVERSGAANPTCTARDTTQPRSTQGKLASS